MSFYYKNKVFDLFEIKEIISDDYEYDEFIEIINNETITFNLSDLFLVPNSEIDNLENIETIKFYIDWGDETNDRLSKPLVKGKNSIGFQEENTWKVIQHKFNCDKKKSDEKREIRISVYNSCGDKKDVIIKYGVLYKTLYDLGTEMVLYGANTTNTNKVSYVLKQIKTDSVFVVRTLDWKEIYGNDEVEETIANISENFSNEFVNEDSSSWDWNSLPTIVNFGHSFKGDDVECSFDVDKLGILVDEWTPQLEILSDGENPKLKITNKQTIDNEFCFSYTFTGSKTGLTLSDLPKTPIYVAYINPFVGVNGVSDESEKYYFLQDDKKPKPREFTSPVITKKDNNLIFSFSIPEDYPKSSITKANLTLQGREKIEDDTETMYENLRDVKIEYNLLEGMQKTINKNTYNFEIPIRNIPDKIRKTDGDEVGAVDVHYKLTLQTNDVLGGDDKNDFDEVVIDNSIFKGYSIGNFVPNTPEDAPKIFFENNNNTLNMTWQFDNKDIFDQVEICIKDEDNNIVKEWLHNHYGDADSYTFDGGLSSEKEKDAPVKFTKEINGNELDDGKYKFFVVHKLNMRDFYDSRSVEASEDYTFEYITPEIKINEVYPYVKISVDNKNENSTPNVILAVKVKGENKNGEDVKDIKFTSIKNDNKDDEEDDEIKSTVISDFEYDLLVPEYDEYENGDEIIYKTTFSAANVKDDKNRPGISDPAIITITKGTESFKESILPYDYVENLENSYDIYSVKGIGDVSYQWVLENTLSDIRREYIASIIEKSQDGFYTLIKDYYTTLFCGYESNNLKWVDGIDEASKTPYMLFDTINVTINGDKEIVRFIPVSVHLKENQELYDYQMNRIDVSSIKTSCVYRKETDTNTMTINWGELKMGNGGKPILCNQNKILHNRLEFGYEENKKSHVISTTNVLGMTEYTYSGLEMSKKYKIKMNISSLEMKSISDSEEDQPIFYITQNTVGKDDVMIETKLPSVTKITTNDTNSYITWHYNLYHKSCDEACVVYEVDGNQSEISIKGSNSVQSKAIQTGKKVKYWYKIKSQYFKDDVVGEVGNDRKTIKLLEAEITV